MLNRGTGRSPVLLTGVRGGAPFVVGVRGGAPYISIGVRGGASHIPTGVRGGAPHIILRFYSSTTSFMASTMSTRAMG